MSASKYMQLLAQLGNMSLDLRANEWLCGDTHPTPNNGVAPFPAPLNNRVAPFSTVLPVWHLFLFRSKPTRINVLHLVSLVWSINIRVHTDEYFRCMLGLADTGRCESTKILGNPHKRKSCSSRTFHHLWLGHLDRLARTSEP